MKIVPGGSPASVMAVATLVIVLIAGITGAGSAVPDPSVDLILTPSHPPESLTPDVSLYPYGEPVILNITFRNEGPGPVTILGVPPRMGINHIEGPDFRTYQRTNSARVLQAGESNTTVLVWDQKDDRGTQVAPGIYTIGAYYLYSVGDNGGVWDVSGGILRTGTVKILIRSPGGSLQKNMSLHQTERDAGIAATLVSLDCDETHGTASFDVEIPEKTYDVTQRPAGLVPCDINLYPSAMYRIDDGNPMKFLDMDFICDTSPSQVHKVHLISEPLPADAKSMEIMITRFGNQEGSWKYRIDLVQSESGQVPGQASTTALPLPAIIPAAAIGIGFGIVRCRKRR